MLQMRLNVQAEAALRNYDLRWMCAGARVLSKAYPEERVGVFARKNGKVEVVEYSELDPKEAAATFDSAPLPETILRSQPAPHQLCYFRWLLFSLSGVYRA